MVKRPTTLFPFIPSPPRVIREALSLAEISCKDTLIDLGCGDGRVTIIAAKYFGSRGVCVEVNDRLCALAEANVKFNKVNGKVQVICEDLFEYDLSQATVVYLYLYGSGLKALSGKLERELQSGSKVITLDFPIEGWTPNKVHWVLDDGGVIRTIYIYVIGSHVSSGEERGGD